MSRIVAGAGFTNQQDRFGAFEIAALGHGAGSVRPDMRRLLSRTLAGFHLWWARRSSAARSCGVRGPLPRLPRPEAELSGNAGASGLLAGFFNQRGELRTAMRQMLPTVSDVLRMCRRQIARPGNSMLGEGILLNGGGLVWKPQLHGHEQM